MKFLLITALLILSSHSFAAGKLQCFTSNNFAGEESEMITIVDQLFDETLEVDRHLEFLDLDVQIRALKKKFPNETYLEFNFKTAQGLEFGKGKSGVYNEDNFKVFMSLKNGQKSTYFSCSID